VNDKIGRENVILKNLASFYIKALVFKKIDYLIKKE